MEKILKLIKSPNRDDLEIGIRLLLSRTSDEVLEFFNKHSNNRELIDVINLDISEEISKNKDFTYIKLNDRLYFLHYHRWLRLRKLPSSVNQDIPVISLKEYLYGEDI